MLCMNDQTKFLFKGRILMNLKSSFFKVCETLDKIKYTTFDFDQFFLEYRRKQVKVFTHSLNVIHLLSLWLHTVSILCYNIIVTIIAYQLYLIILDSPLPPSSWSNLIISSSRRAMVDLRYLISSSYITIFSISCSLIVESLSSFILYAQIPDTTR